MVEKHDAENNERNNADTDCYCKPYDSGCLKWELNMLYIIFDEFNKIWLNNAFRDVRSPIIIIYVERLPQKTPVQDILKRFFQYDSKMSSRSSRKKGLQEIMACWFCYHTEKKIFENISNGRPVRWSLYIYDKNLTFRIL